MADIPSHHMIYGSTIDYLTGESIVDTDDERYRQSLARMMVEEKGFKKEDITPRLTIDTLFNQNFVTSKIDLLITLGERKIIVIRYGPGSLVTRERPALAAAKVFEHEYQIPFTIVTNGIDAELLDTLTGKIIATGLPSIPDRDSALTMQQKAKFVPLTDAARRERELRILNAFDLEACCVGSPCALPSAKEG